MVELRCKILTKKIKGGPFQERTVTSKREKMAARQRNMAALCLLILLFLAFVGIVEAGIHEKRLIEALPTISGFFYTFSRWELFLYLFLSTVRKLVHYCTSGYLFSYLFCHR